MDVYRCSVSSIKQMYLMSQQMFSPCLTLRVTRAAAESSRSPSLTPTYYARTHEMDLGRGGFKKHPHEPWFEVAMKDVFLQGVRVA